MTKRPPRLPKLTAFACAAVGILGLTGSASASLDSGNQAADAYSRGYETLMTRPYSALVRVGVTEKTGAGRTSTDVVAFDSAASTAGYAVSNLSPWPFGPVPVARMVGSGGRVYLQIDGEPRSVVDTEAAQSRIYFDRGSPLVLPPPDTLGDHTPERSDGPHEDVFRATVATDAARATVARVIAGRDAERVAPRLHMERAVVRVAVDPGTGRITRTHLHLRAQVPANAFEGITVPARVKKLAGSRVTVVSRFSVLTLPREPEVGVPDKTMPLNDWADTVEARARILEAAVVLSVYRDMTGSLRGLSPRMLRAFNPAITIVHGRGSTRRGTVGLVIDSGGRGFTLRVTARNGWTYRADSRARNHFAGTCRMAGGKSCGTWVGG